MKKLVSGIAAAVLSLTMASLPHMQKQAQAAEVYPIASELDFMMAAEHPEGSYELVKDITLTSSVHIGSSERPFTGTFDGNGYAIESKYVPFSVIGNSGVVRDLNITGFMESWGSNADSDYDGMVATVNNGTISGVKARGKGGNRKITAGIAGKNTGTIINCVGTGDSNAAALVGVNEGLLQNCYTYSNKPLVYENYTGTITNCYGSAEAGKGVVNGSDNVVLLSKGQRTQSASYSGWDFNSIWTTYGDTNLPIPLSVIGKGTQAEPYLVRSKEMLRFLGCGERGKGKYFKLVERIDSGAEIGTEEEPFNGIFDGNNVKTGAMLFGVVGTDAVIYNMNVGGDMSGRTIAGGVAAKNYGTIRDSFAYLKFKGGKDLGGIAGENIYGTIENCGVSGVIDSNSSGAGGIVGYNNRGTIRGCESLATVSVSDHSSGGIVGDNSGGIVENCVSCSSAICGGDEIGGIAGRLYNGSIKNCVSINPIKGKEKCGGIVGAVIESGEVEGCYFDTDTDTAQTEYGIGSASEKMMGVTSDAIKNAATFAGWDFNGTWCMGEKYPELIGVRGNGTKEHPYIIREYWPSLLDKSNKSTGNRFFYLLMYNYDSHIGKADDPFEGSIDGNGCNIKTANIYIGEKGYIGNCVLQYPIEENKGTVEYCRSTVSLANVNSGVIRNSGAVGHIATRNIGKISNCISAKYPIADTNNAATIENSCTLNGNVFVNKNDNGALITDCTAVNSSRFVNENYADINRCSVQCIDDNRTDALFAVRNSGSIKECTVQAAAGAPAIPMVQTGTGDIKTGSVSVPRLFNYGKANDTGEYVRAEVKSNTPKFSDISGHWAADTILALAEKGVINGYEDGSFQPDKSVSKAEFLKLLLSAANVKEDRTATQYIDANQSWASGYVSAAVMKGITANINKSDSEFGINDALTRVEAAVLAGRLLKPEGGKASFTDDSLIPDWAKSAVGAAVEKKIITGMEDGSFRPGDNLTRAQAAAIVSRVMN